MLQIKCWFPFLYLSHLIFVSNYWQNGTQKLAVQVWIAYILGKIKASLFYPLNIGTQEPTSTSSHICIMSYNKYICWQKPALPFHYPNNNLMMRRALASLSLWRWFYRTNVVLWLHINDRHKTTFSHLITFSD